MPTPPINYAAASTEEVKRRRSPTTWVMLLIVWAVGLVVWAFYIVVLAYLLYRVLG